MSKASILIVEDEQIVAMDIQGNLERNGYQVVGRTDRGEKAVKMAEELHPDLILMDIHLKGDIDGIEAATRIRKKIDIPVIFLTAFSTQTVVERARQAEPYGYIVKPFDEREKIITIEMALYKHGMERKLRESENKFRGVIERASDGIALIDAQGNVVEWNSALENIAGLKRSEVIGRPIWEITFQMLPKEKKVTADMEMHASLWNAAIQEGYANKDQLTEREIETPKGNRRIVQSNGFIVESLQGVLAGVIMRDVTEQKQAETELRKLTMAVEQSANSIIITDTEGNIEYVNPKFLQVSGYSLPEVLGQNPRILRSGEHPREFYQQMWDTIKSGKLWHGEFRNKRKDGTFYWEETSVAPVYDSTGKMINFIAIKEDVTIQKTLEEAERDQYRLAEALRDTAMALNSTLKLDDILDRILDNIGTLVNYDTAMVALIEGDKVQKTRYRNNPQNAKSHLPIGDLQANLITVPILKTVVNSRKPQIIPDIEKDIRWQAVSIPGMERIHSLVCAPIENHEGVMGVINIISALPDFFTPLHIERIMAFASQAAVAMENARLYEHAQRLSMTDPLTELFNMRYFLDFAALELERVRRYTRTLSVAMIDIDHFKNVNDTYGHHIGDLVLREVAARIKNSVRAVDVIARYGGEEFVVLMPETDLEEALQVAERIRQSVADYPVKNKNADISVMLSFGIAEASKNAANLDELIKHADQALYKAKANGRNRVEVYSNVG